MSLLPRLHKLTIIFSIISFILVAASASILAIKNAPGITTGVHSGNVDLSGLDISTAQKSLEDNFNQNITGKILILNYDNQEQSIAASDIDLVCDSETTARAAAKIGHSGNFLRDVFSKLHCLYQGNDIPLAINYNEASLTYILNQIIQKAYIAPVDAYCYVDPAGVKLVPEKIGKSIDREQLLSTVKAKLATATYPQVININSVDIKPSVTASNLKHINTILASYTTKFNAGAANRSENVALAAKNLSGTLVNHNEVFSFNNAVGPRLAASGYREAPVIIDGKVVPGIGGGVCQVSSTLYDAILLAGLTPVERTAHYFPADYVPPAFDATVADGVIDFKFRNNLPHSIYVFTRTTNDTLSIFILGSNTDKLPYTITLKSSYNNGAASAYRVFSKDGTIIKNEFLHTDK
ncbi:VanW family protein [Pectinatus frisingensis]|uniref:VanW family protein n=1 Tax=Pectinatus frisingensis TaxID=865 RepID=UPI003D806685